MVIRFVVAVLAVFCATQAFAVPLNDVQLAQEGRFPFDQTLTVRQAMERFFYFSRVTWSVYYDINDKKVVEARGYFDMAKIKTRTDAATCVNRAGTFVGLTDSQPFMILQFRPDFIKQRATLIYSGLWGLFDEGRLDDPDLLWAKALVTGELPSPAPLCNMAVNQISSQDRLALEEQPVVDPKAPQQDEQPAPGTTPGSFAAPQPAAQNGAGRLSPGKTKPADPTPKSATENATQAKSAPPTPTQTGR